MDHEATDTHSLARETEAAEAAAWADLMAAMPPETGQALGASVAAVAGGIVLAARALPLVTFNRAFGFGSAAPPDDAALAAIRARLVSDAHPVAQLQLAPFAWHGREAAIAAAGFRPADSLWAKLARRAAARPEDPPAPDVDIAAAGTGTAGDFAATVANGFGMPPLMQPWLAALVGRPGWRCLLARIGGRPVAGAALFLAPGGEVAWLGVAATLPEARGRGAQKALILARLALAAAEGCRRAHSETAVLPGRNPSLANLTACGFSLVHHRRTWTVAP